MHTTAKFVIRCLVFVTLASIAAFGSGGCSSSDKDPFEDKLMGPQKYHDYVPQTARPVASGTGTLTFTAPEDGTLYLLDTSAMSTIEGTQKPKALVSGFVRAGNEVVVDPQDRRVHLKGRKGLQLKDMDPTHTHELRFDPSEVKKSS